MISVHFYKADSLLGHLVGFFGKTEYVHCAVQIDGKHMIETDAGRHASIVHLHKKADEIIFLPDIDEKAVLTRFNELVGADYDYGGVFAIKNIGKENKKKYTCVELSMAVMFGFCQNIKPDSFRLTVLNIRSGSDLHCQNT